MSESRSKVVAIVSGGLDSITMLYKLQRDHDISSIVSFNYGQRHKKELKFARRHAELFGVTHHVIDLSQSGLVEAFASSGSSLVTDTDVPEGHYAEENMKSTVVPNRNMIMLSIAIGIAVSENAEWVATGVHSGDHFIYPDCRPVFIGYASAAGIVGNEGFGVFEGILAPFMDSTKEDIAYEAFELGVPIGQTWSCYKGGDIHCGKCGTCVERAEALAGAAERINNEPRMFDVSDPTEYEDNTYWREALQNAPKEA